MLSAWWGGYRSGLAGHEWLGHIRQRWPRPERIVCELWEALPGGMYTSPAAQPFASSLSDDLTDAGPLAPVG